MKKITQNELNLILEKHKLWLKNDLEGERANLSNTDLRGLDLRGVDLAFANLKSANLADVDLSSANLKDANLSYANLSNADLIYANLSNVNLSLANLSNASLSCADLFETNLSNTNLSNTDLTNLASFDFALRNTITDKKYYQLTNIGSRQGITTYCVDDNWIFCGCWKDYKGGSLEKFEKRIEKIYGKKGEKPNKKYYDEYKNAIKYFKLCKKGVKNNE